MLLMNLHYMNTGHAEEGFPFALVQAVETSRERDRNGDWQVTLELLILENDIAGICAPPGRVLGMMPHPERNALPWHHPAGTQRPPPEDAGGGLRIFENAVRWAREHA